MSLGDAFYRVDDGVIEVFVGIRELSEEGFGDGSLSRRLSAVEDQIVSGGGVWLSGS